MFPHDLAQARYDIHTAGPKRTPGNHEFPLEALKTIFSAIGDDKKNQKRSLGGWPRLNPEKTPSGAP